MHISRLANIENGNIVPGLHKFYTLAALYHLNPLDLFRWFEIPIEECFGDGINFQVPRTHVAAPPSGLRVPLRFDPGFDPRRTDFLSRMVERWRNFEGALKRERPQHCYGHIGLADRSRCCFPEAWCWWTPGCGKLKLQSGLANTTGRCILLT
jgi:hypothetical protein